MSKVIDPERELERLTEELQRARERTEAVHKLNGTIADTMHSLAMDTAEIAKIAFDWAESVEMLVAKSQRLGRELFYVRQQEDVVDIPTLRLLQRQLQDAADEINIKIDHAVDAELEEASQLGQAERTRQ